MKNKKTQMQIDVENFKKNGGQVKKIASGIVAEKHEPEVEAMQGYGAQLIQDISGRDDANYRADSYNY